MRKYTSKAQAPGLRDDGIPNRAMRRHHPGAGNATVKAFMLWYWVASNLIPGYIPPTDEEKAA